MAKRVKELTKEEVDEIVKKYDLDENELENIAGGSGCHESGENPEFEVGQRVKYYMGRSGTSSMGGNFEVWYEGTILENLGKQGSHYPEFKYRISRDGYSDTYEIWEGEIKAL